MMAGIRRRSSRAPWTVPPVLGKWLSDGVIEWWSGGVRIRLGLPLNRSTTPSRPPPVRTFRPALAPRGPRPRAARLRPDRRPLDLLPGGRGAGDDARLLVGGQGAAEVPDSADLPAAD